MRFILVFLILIAQFCKLQAQNVSFNSGTDSTYNAFLVSNVNENQVDTLQTFFAVIIKSADLNKELGHLKGGVLQSLEFNKTGCGYNNYSSNLEVFIKHTRDSQILNSKTWWDKNQVNSKNIYLNPRFNFEKQSGQLRLDLNQKFRYDPDSNLLILIKWDRNSIQSCYKNYWFGKNVTDSTVMTWVKHQGVIGPSVAPRFKPNFSLTVDTSIRICTTQTTLDINVTSSSSANAKLDSAYGESNVELQLSNEFGDFVLARDVLRQSKLEYLGLKANTTYSIFAKDSCRSDQYPGIHHHYRIKTTCLLDQLDSIVYYDGFEKNNPRKSFLSCWEFDSLERSFGTKANASNYSLSLHQFNEWAGTNPIAMDTNSSYMIEFAYKSGKTYKQNMKFYFVVDTLPISNKNYQIIDSGQTKTTTFLQFSHEFKPKKKTNYYFGFVWARSNNILTMETVIDDLYIYKKKEDCPLPILNSIHRLDEIATYVFKNDTSIKKHNVQIIQGKQEKWFSAADTVVKVSGLEPFTEYQFRLKSTCPNSDRINSLVGVFKTLCKVDTIKSLASNVEIDFEDLDCFRNDDTYRNYTLRTASGLKGNGLIVNNNTRVYGNSLYIEKSNPVQIAFYYRPYGSSSSVRPSLVYYKNGDESVKYYPKYSIDTVSYTHFYLAHLVLDFDTSAYITLGFQANGANFLIDELRVGKPAECLFVQDFVAPFNISRKNASIETTTSDTTGSILLQLIDENERSEFFNADRNDTLILENLLPNTKYTVKWHRLCNSDTGISLLSQSFVTQNSVDSIHDNDTFFYGFETAKDRRIFTYDPSYWSIRSSNGPRWYHNSIEGQGYIYADNTTKIKPLTSNKIYMEKGQLSHFQFDFIRYSSVDFLEIIVYNEANKVVGIKRENYNRHPQRGRFEYDMVCPKDGIYYFKIIATDRTSIDNITYYKNDKECEPISYKNLEVINGNNEITILAKKIDTSIDSINIKIKEEFGATNYYTIKRSDFIKTGFKWSTKPSTIYDLVFNEYCPVPLNFESRYKIISPHDSVLVVDSKLNFETSFDENDDSSKHFKYSPNNEDLLLVVDREEELHLSYSGRKMLKADAFSGTMRLPLFKLDSGVSYNLDFWYKIRQSASRSLHLAIYNQDFSDTIYSQNLVLKSNSIFTPISILFGAQKPGRYYIEFTNLKGDHPIYLEDFSLSVASDYTRPIIVDSMILQSPSEIKIYLKNNFSNSLSKFKVETFSYGNSMGSVGDTILTSNSSNSFILPQMQHNKYLVSRIYGLDSNGKAIQQSKLFLHHSTCIADTMKYLGSSFLEDFESVGRLNDIPFCSQLIGYNYKKVGAYASGSNSTFSGFKAADVSGFETRPFVLVKDSLYRLSAQIYSTISRGVMFTLRDTGNKSIPLGDTLVYMSSGNYKEVADTFRPDSTKEYTLGLRTTKSNHFMLDDFKVERIRIFEKHRRPILKLDAVDYDWFEISWDTNSSSSKYLLEVYRGTELDSIYSINSIGTNSKKLSNLIAATQYYVRIAYVGSDTVWSNRLRYITGYKPFKIENKKPFVYDFENLSQKRLYSMQAENPVVSSSYLEHGGAYCGYLINRTSSTKTFKYVIGPVFLQTSELYQFEMECYRYGSYADKVYLSRSFSTTGAKKILDYTGTYCSPRACYLYKSGLVSGKGQYFIIVESKLSSYSSVRYDDIKMSLKTTCPSGTTTSINIGEITSSSAAVIAESNNVKTKEIQCELETYLPDYKGEWKKTISTHTGLERKDTLILNDLKYYGNYKIRAKSLCSENNFTSWTSWKTIDNFCKIPKIEIDKDKPWNVNFNILPKGVLPDCWTSHKVSVENGLRSGTEIDYMLVFAANVNSYLVSKKFIIDTALEYKVGFNLALAETDSFKVEVLRSSDNSLFLDTCFKSTSYFSNPYFFQFKPKGTNEFYLRFTSDSNISKVYFDDLSVKPSNKCPVNKIEIKSVLKELLINLENHDSTKYNLVQVQNLNKIEQNKWKLNANEKNIKNPIVGQAPYLLNIMTVCKNGDTSDQAAYSLFTDSILDISNGMCESFDDLDRNEIPQGWRATGTRYWGSVNKGYPSTSFTISNCCGNGMERSYYNTSRFNYGTYYVHYLETPAFEMQANQLYKVGTTYTLFHGQWNISNGEFAWDSVQFGLYNVNTKEVTMLNGLFSRTLSMAIKSESRTFIQSKTGIYKLRIYAHARRKTGSKEAFILLDNICVEKVQPPSGPSNCSPPNNLIADIDKNLGTATLKWSRKSAAISGYEWTLNILDSTEASFRGRTYESNDTFATVEDLKQGKIYVLSVRSNCTEKIDSSRILYYEKENAWPDIDLSNWSSFQQEAVPCQPTKVGNFKILDNFEDPSGTLPTCWNPLFGDVQIANKNTNFYPNSGKKYLLFSDQEIAAIESNEYLLEKDSTYQISFQIQNDGRVGFDSLEIFLINSIGTPLKIGSIQNKFRSKIYLEKKFRFSPKTTNSYRIQLVSNFNTKHYSKGVAIDDFSIQMVEGNCGIPNYELLDDDLSENVKLVLNQLSGLKVSSTFNHSDYSKSIPVSNSNDTIKINRKLWGNLPATFALKFLCGSDWVAGSEFAIPELCLDTPLHVLNKENSVETQFLNSDSCYRRMVCWKSKPSLNWVVDHLDTVPYTQIKTTTPASYLFFNGQNAKDNSLKSPWFKPTRYLVNKLTVRGYAPTNNGLIAILYNQKNKILWVDTLAFSSLKPIEVFKYFQWLGHDSCYIKFEPIDTNILIIEEIRITAHDPNCKFDSKSKYISSTQNSILFELADKAKGIVEWKICEIKDSSAPAIVRGLGYNGKKVEAKGLKPQTKYSIFVRSICTNGDSSYFVHSFDAYTECLVDTLVKSNYRCHDFEDLDSEFNCYNYSNWKIGRDTVFKLFTTNGRKYLYQDQRVLSTYESSKFYIEKEQPIELRFLLRSYGGNAISTFKCMLKDANTGKRYVFLDYSDTSVGVIAHQEANYKVPKTGEYTIEISALPNVGKSIMIDQVCYKIGDVCYIPQEVNLDSVSENSVWYSWLNSKSYDSLHVKLFEFKNSKWNLLAENKVDASSQSSNLNLLTPDTEYKIGLFAYCDNKYTTDSLELTFRTDCAVDTIEGEKVYFESFEETKNDFSEDCFQVYSNYWKIDSFKSNFYQAKHGSKYLLHEWLDSPIINRKIHLLENKKYVFGLGYAVASGAGVKSLNFGLISKDTSYIQSINAPNNKKYIVSHKIIDNALDRDVQFKIEVLGNNRVILDSLFVEEYYGCEKPTGFQLTNISSDSISFNWSASHTEFGGYRIAYKQKGTNSWNFENTADTQYVLSNLYPGTTYVIKVKSMCKYSESSEYADSIEFLIDCPEINVTRLNKFGEFEPNDSLWPCWELNNTSNFDSFNWRVNEKLYDQNGQLFDQKDGVGEEYMSVKGLSFATSNNSSNVESPYINFNSNNNPKLLSIKVAKSFLSNIDTLSSNNTLNLMMLDSNQNLDTLLSWQSALNHNWSELAVELPSGIKKRKIILQYVRNGTEPIVQDLAVDQLQIIESTCADIFDSDSNQTNDANRICLTKDSILYYGFGKSELYKTKVLNYAGLSFKAIDLLLNDSAYQLREGNKLIYQSYYVVGATSLDYFSIDSQRKNFIDHIQFKIPKSHLAVIIDSTSKIKKKLSKAGIDQLFILTSNDSIIYHDQLFGIDSTKYKVLRQFSSISDSTWTLDSNKNFYLISLDYNSIKSNLVFVLSGAINTTSLSSFKIKNIEVYPNPFSKELIIDFKNSSSDEFSKMLLIDQTGKIVYEQKVIHQSNRLNVGHLPKGNYVLVAEGKDGVFYKKVVKL